MRRRIESGRYGNRVRALLAVVLGLLFVPAPVTAQEKAKPAGTWYAETVQTGDTGIRVMNIWSKGRKLRSETVVSGTQLLTIVNGDTYYNILPSAGTGVAIQRSPRAIVDDEKGGRPFGHDVERLLARGAEKASTERMMGRELTVYRLSSDTVREEVWATADAEKLPVKLVYTDRKEGKTAETLLNWSRDLPLADSFFEPDPRISLERMSYEEFVSRVKDGKVASFPPLHVELLSGRSSKPE